MHPGVKPIEKSEVKRFPVRLLRGYFPADPAWPRHPISGDVMKVQRGEVAELPIEEARDLIKSGLAERADQIAI